MSLYGDGKRLSPIDELKSPTVRVIREIYEGENSHESFLADLDMALIEKADYIIVEPAKVADETSRWIMVGNCLHKTAVVTGLASIVAGFALPKNVPLCTSFGIISLFSTTLYTVSWDSDPCIEYQIERNPKKLPRFPSLINEFTSPVIMHLESNKKAKYLHRIVTLLAVGVCGYRIYEAVK